jgi:hypothetical protein
MSAVSSMFGGGQKDLMEAAAAQQRVALQAQEHTQNQQRELVDDAGQKADRAAFMQNRIKSRGRGLLAYSSDGAQNQTLGGGT